ncbi:MAG: ATP-dependent DNA helicase, partial [Pseudomonadota bacterium]
GPRGAGIVARMAASPDLLSAGGALAARVPGFVPRQAQQLMAEAVAAALARREVLAVEAGTGTGKTFAYLIPVLAAAQRTIISTGTRALQDQLFHRDIPLLAEATGAPLDVALLKGRANYLCRHRLQGAGERVESRRAARDLDAVRRWEAATATGDRSELAPVAEDSPVWPWVTSTIDNCLGQGCDFYDRCFVVRARRAAARAELVVVNHHLLFADLAMKEAGFEDFLPGADALIIDEAHLLPDLASRFFGTSFSSYSLGVLLDEARVAGHAAGGPPLAAVIDRCKTALSRLRAAAPHEPGRYDGEDIESAIAAPLASLRDALDGVYAALLPLGDLGADLESLGNRCHALLTALLQVRSAEAGEGLHWLEVSRRALTLNLTPLDVSAEVGGLIHGRDAAWVMTSATLAVGEDFSHFLSRLGIGDARAIKLPSPYDLASRCLVYLPSAMPEPAAPDHPQRVADTAAAVAARTDGGVFVLFTSHRALARAADYVRDRANLFPGRRVLVQGTAPRDDLLQEFRGDGRAVLLATGTFWEGVDVRGTALTVVVIDKLPFASPGDPLVMARLEYLRRRGENGFMGHQLPQAVLALKQGAGRLLRDDRDYGVIVLCDPRVSTKRYGATFLDALAPAPVTTSPDDVTAFFERLGPRAADMTENHG